MEGDFGKVLGNQIRPEVAEHFRVIQADLVKAGGAAIRFTCEHRREVKHIVLRHR